MYDVFLDSSKCMMCLDSSVDVKETMFACSQQKVYLSLWKLIALYQPLILIFQIWALNSIHLHRLETMNKGQRPQTGKMVNMKQKVASRRNILA